MNYDEEVKNMDVILQIVQSHRILGIAEILLLTGV